MITGTSKTEKEYRALSLDSSSSLKEFSLDRRKYYKKHILGENVEEKESSAILMGKLVETMLMEPELFDEKFSMSSLISPPTGLMLEFVEALYRQTIASTDENGNVNRSFEDIAKDAYAESGFKMKFETVIGKFVGSEAEMYYEEIRNVRAKGLSVVTAEEASIAERIVETLKTSDVTHEIVNLVSSSRYEVFNQMQIESFEVDGLKLKGMIDKVVIDHQKKTIQPYDLKCVWSVENFYEDYYLYRRAYIQAYVYYCACLTIKNDVEGDYKVLPLQFIVCDSGSYYSPLIYTLDGEDMADAYEGFEHKGRKYPGVHKIIKDLKWAVENNKWDICRENFQRKGVLNIKG
jgi:hypothetical protein